MVRVDQRIERDRRQEIGRGIAPDAQGAGRLALQPDVDAAREHAIGIAATVAFQQVKFNNTPGDVTSPAAMVGKQNAAQAGLSYDFKVVKVFAQGQYIKSDIDSATGDIQHSNGQIGASVPIGAGSLLLSYAYGKVKNDVADVERNTAAVAYDYNLSKRTGVYVAYYYDKVVGLSHGNNYGVGVRHRF